MILTRRSLLSGLAGAAALAGSFRFRFAICNETFEGSSFQEGCRLAKRSGYTGLEIAPGTLSSNPVELSADRRREFRQQMQKEGIQYAGLHSLVSIPPRLHLTTPDEAVRRTTWDYFRKLIDLAADLGDNAVMVLGSGKQRASVNGSTAADAKRRLTDGLATMAPHAQTRGVRILIEPLSPQFTDVVNTLGEAVAVVKSIGSPAVSSMFDTHNTVAETEPHDQVIRQYASSIQHVHLNELDGRHPGTGKYDFELILKTLSAVRFNGWISVEVFQFKPSGQAIAEETMALLQNIQRKVEGSRQ